MIMIGNRVRNRVKNNYTSLIASVIDIFRDVQFLIFHDSIRDITDNQLVECSYEAFSGLLNLNLL